MANEHAIAIKSCCILINQVNKRSNAAAMAAASSVNNNARRKLITCNSTERGSRNPNPNWGGRALLLFDVELGFAFVHMCDYQIRFLSNYGSGTAAQAERVPKKSQLKLIAMAAEVCASDDKQMDAVKTKLWSKVNSSSPSEPIPSQGRPGHSLSSWVPAKVLWRTCMRRGLGCPGSARRKEHLIIIK